MEDIKESEKLNFEKVWLTIQETNRQLQEAKELIAKVSLDTDKKFQDTDKKFQDTDKEFQETKRIQRDTDRQIRELGKQIGGLANKFGSFTEGLFMPSVVNILENKFNCTTISENYRFRRNGDNLEIDILGISSVACYVVEIKSHYRSEYLEQVLNSIKLFTQFHPNYNNLKKYGAIVSTDCNSELYKQIIDKGFYYISVADEIAKLKIPKNFQPKAF